MCIYVYRAENSTKIRVEYVDMVCIYLCMLYVYIYTYDSIYIFMHD
jgi:hypothetical protein